MNKKTEEFLFFFILISTILSILFNDCIFKIINENKILYIYSLLPQTLGAIYGLTITGYIFYIGTQNNRLLSDNTLYEIIEEGKIEQFNALKTLSSLVFLSIIFCILNIYLHNKNHPHIEYFSIITMSLSNSFSFAALAANFLFIIKIIDPKSVEKISAKIIEKAKQSDSKESTQLDQENSIEMSKFMNEYIQLERMARSIISQHGISENNRNFSSWMDFKQLSSLGIIRNITADMLDHLRKYRNALVHSEPINYIPHNINELLKVAKENLENEYTSWLREKENYQINKTTINEIPDRP